MEQEPRKKVVEAGPSPSKRSWSGEEAEKEAPRPGKVARTAGAAPGPSPAPEPAEASPRRVAGTATEPPEAMPRRASGPSAGVDDALPRKVVAPMREDATSTTPSDIPARLPTDPAEWSIEHVIQHIKQIDPALAVHADTFRKHVRTLTNKIMRK